MPEAKKKMAFVDLCNYKDWPMGGMLEYERSILRHLVNIYDVDLWGVSVDGEIDSSVVIDDKQYEIKVFGNVKTKRKVIPNYWRGLSICKVSSKEFSDYDVVYIHTGSCAVGLLNKINRKKTTVAYHQHGLSYLTSHALIIMIQKPFYYISQKTSDIVFVVSDAESVHEHAMRMKDRSNARFVPIGSPIEIKKEVWDSAYFRAKKTENMKQSFIYTGRLDSHKDVGTVIEAFSFYVKEFSSDAELLIVGDGDQRSNLESLVMKHGIAERVEFTGAVPHEMVDYYLDKASVYLTASHGEGSSVSVLEAYAHGIPVICFAVPGLEKQVVDGKTGILINKRSARNMYKAMVEINKQWSDLSLGCLHEVQKYDAKLLTQYIADEIRKVKGT